MWANADELRVACHRGWKTILTEVLCAARVSLASWSLHSSTLPDVLTFPVHLLDVLSKASGFMWYFAKLWIEQWQLDTKWKWHELTCIYHFACIARSWRKRRHRAPGFKWLQYLVLLQEFWFGNTFRCRLPVLLALSRVPCDCYDCWKDQFFLWGNMTTWNPVVLGIHFFVS